MSAITPSHVRTARARACALRGTRASVHSVCARAVQPCVITTLTHSSCDLPAAVPPSRSNSFYPLAWRVVGAINAGLGKEMHFPIDNEPALNELEARFRSRWGANSAYSYKGVVGALDGLVIKILRPSKRRHHCPQAFVCGRYKCFGIAFQVIVGPDCEFLWSFGNAPGSVHDSVAFGMSQLYDKLQSGKMDHKCHIASQATARTVRSLGCSPPIQIRGAESSRWTRTPSTGCTGLTGSASNGHLVRAPSDSRASLAERDLHASSDFDRTRPCPRHQACSSGAS